MTQQRFSTYNSTDVYFTPELLMFSPFANRACTGLHIIDDEIAERRERYEFSLKRTADLDRRITVDPTPGKIYIEDNDGISVLKNGYVLTVYFIADMFVGFSFREYTGTETTGYAAVCVHVLNPPVGGAFSVSLLPEEGTVVEYRKTVQYIIFHRKGIFI